MHEPDQEQKALETERMALGTEPFSFRCHPGIDCYLVCCHKVELILQPYDIVRLKNRLRLSASEFLFRHTRLGEGNHPYFPAIMLNMVDEPSFPCPFLGPGGCSVYRDRPSACRTYPLERGVERVPGKGIRSRYYLVRHPYCHGHQETKQYTVREWERDQQLAEYNLFNDRWAEVDALFATNPWQGEGAAGPRQRLAFMACYDIDTFRTYCDQHRLLRRYRIDRHRRRRIERDDGELLKFGFDWLLHTLGDRSTLMPVR